MRKLLDFIDRLEDAHIAYQIEHVRDSILIAVAVPGERWEIEFFDDGHVETEIFRSSGGVTREESILESLVTAHGS